MCKSDMTGSVLDHTINDNDGPMEKAHEEELGEYERSLARLLQHDVGEIALSTITTEMWTNVESCLRSLESYLKGIKVGPEQVRKSKITETIMLALNSLEALDKLGLDIGREDAKLIEQVWGLLDKIGSGLYYLLDVDKRSSAKEHRPTTRSIFLLVSAPPAAFKLSTSRDEWQEKELKKSQAKITELVLNPGSPITADQEQRWSLVFRELEKLEKLFDTDISSKIIKATTMDTTIVAANKTLETLFQDIDPSKAEEEFALMLVSWELVLRISKYIDNLIYLK